MGQADQQLLTYADRLTSRPFAASPVYGFASGAPAGGGPSGGVLGIEVRGSGGQLVMRAAKRPGHGPAIPAVAAGSAAPAGRPVTVGADGGGGSWRVIAEPIHYRVRRIPFSYSADGVSVFITGQDRPGLSGTLVVGLMTGGTGDTIGRLLAGYSNIEIGLMHCVQVATGDFNTVLRKMFGVRGETKRITAAEMLGLPEKLGPSFADKVAGITRQIGFANWHALALALLTFATVKILIRVSVYVVSGICSALAGLILASRAGSANSSMATGEELTHDWATTDDVEYAIKCRCGTSACRRIITGKDWLLKELQRKYRALFS